MIEIPSQDDLRNYEELPEIARRQARRAWLTSMFVAVCAAVTAAEINPTSSREIVVLTASLVTGVTVIVLGLALRLRSAQQKRELPERAIKQNGSTRKS